MSGICYAILRNERRRYKVKTFLSAKGPEQVSTELGSRLMKGLLNNFLLGPVVGFLGL